MAIITLTTDMGLKDYYVSSIKGAIISQLTDCHIVDVSHLIEPWNILQAAFVIKNAYKSFPVGTVHIIGVDTESTAQRRHIVVLFDGHYFIGCDNGIFSLIFDDPNIVIDKVVELNLEYNSSTKTFPTRDIFAKAACHICRGGIIEVLGPVRQVESLNRLIFGDPVFDSNTQTIIGKVIYIDNYGNAITNITAQMFKSASNNRSFNFIYKPKSNRSLEGSYYFETLAESYSDVDKSDLIVLANYLGLIEIAMNQGNARNMLDIGENLQVKFSFGKR